jgi:hypothetical protein
MTQRLQDALKRCAGKPEHLHQWLFYSICRDLGDVSLYCKGRTQQQLVRDIVRLVTEYTTAEEQAMRAADQELLKQTYQREVK